MIRCFVPQHDCDRSGFLIFIEVLGLADHGWTIIEMKSVKKNVRNLVEEGNGKIKDYFCAEKAFLKISY